MHPDTAETFDTGAATAFDDHPAATYSHLTLEQLLRLTSTQLRHLTLAMFCHFTLAQLQRLMLILKLRSTLTQIMRQVTLRQLWRHQLNQPRLDYVPGANFSKNLKSTSNLKHGRDNGCQCN